jgi:hypothetical protein
MRHRISDGAAKIKKWRPSSGILINIVVQPLFVAFIEIDEGWGNDATKYRLVAISCCVGFLDFVALLVIVSEMNLNAFGFNVV